jgi:hypothetical protein
VVALKAETKQLLRKFQDAIAELERANHEDRRLQELSGAATRKGEELRREMEETAKSQGKDFDSYEWNRKISAYTEEQQIFYIHDRRRQALAELREIWQNLHIALDPLRSPSTKDLFEALDSIDKEPWLKFPQRYIGLTESIFESITSGNPTEDTREPTAALPSTHAAIAPTSLTTPEAEGALTSETAHERSQKTEGGRTELATAVPEKRPNKIAREVLQERRAAVEGYKRECKDAGITVTDKDIAKAANKSWNTRDPIAKWKQGLDRNADDTLIRRVFQNRPHLQSKPT